MFLYLVQHGDSMSKDEDPERSLSEKGIQDVNKVAGYIAKIGASAPKAVHSGKARASQTARILAEHLAGNMEVAQSDGMAPMDDPAVWFERLKNIDDDIMLVGHLPHLARLSGLLLCGDSDKGVVNFERGSVLCMSRSEKGSWTVEGFIKPEMVL